jgi:hypothetical protein
MVKTFWRHGGLSHFGKELIVLAWIANLLQPSAEDALLEHRALIDVR